MSVILGRKIVRDKFYLEIGKEMVYCPNRGLRREFVRKGGGWNWVTTMCGGCLFRFLFINLVD
jgi:hypothetical protein